MRKGHRAMGLVPSRGWATASGMRPEQTTKVRDAACTGRDRPHNAPAAHEDGGCNWHGGDRCGGRAATAARTAPPHTIQPSEQHRLVPPCLVGSSSLSVWERRRGKGGWQRWRENRGRGGEVGYLDPQANPPERHSHHASQQSAAGQRLPPAPANLRKQKRQETTAAGGGHAIPHQRAWIHTAPARKSAE